jgi:hypothetical protein
MAQVNPFRVAMQAIGFSLDAARMLTDDQEIALIEELKMLFDAGVDELCKALYRPGGTIVNPNAQARNQPARIPNPGINVPLRTSCS